MNTSPTEIETVRADAINIAMTASARIARLEADLEECREFIEKYSDVNDGDYGVPEPNKAMRLCSMIDETLHGGAF